MSSTLDRRESGRYQGFVIKAWFEEPRRGAPSYVAYRKNDTIFAVYIQLSSCTSNIHDEVGLPVPHKLCTTTQSISESCQSIERGDSEVECLHVSDSAECAIRLANGQADFGLFDTDALLLSCQFYCDEIVPIFELRHKDKTQQSFKFKSVAVVPSNFSIESGKRFENLKNGGLCHPGFTENQLWNDFILKYFERNTYVPECRENLTSIENELQDIRSFFGKACRPGNWVADPNISDTLKKKYPELCELCDDKIACNYKNVDKHGHIGALDCLTSGQGKVAYVALEYVHQYFKENQKSQYQFLCPDGSLQNLNNSNPCAWIKQPWGAIVTRKELVNDLTNKLKKWLNPVTYAAENWSQSLKRIIEEDSTVTNLTKPISLYNYLAEGRKEVDLSKVPTCEEFTIRWCTIDPLEKTKCEWIAKQAIALGIEPRIVCLQANSTFQCMRDIANKKADITTIDSNYGYLARQLYNLGPILYAETNTLIRKDSMIMAVLRKSEDGNYPIKNFNQLKGHRACFPEYGGIAWLSLIKVARVNHIISSVSCKYSGLLSNLLAGACTPGINDDNHGSNAVSKNIENKLCSICPKTNGTIDCTASNENRYYGDKGALTCLTEEFGDIAFVEIGNIKQEESDVDKYQILCRNGSLATKPGLNLDKPELCALSATINSGVIARRNDTEIQRLNAVLALLKLEDRLKYRPSSWRVLHIYGKFNNTDDLLFKSSTFGLVHTTSTLESILSYKELFDHVDECSSAGLLMFSNVTLFSLVLISIYSMI
ncbi:transferrin-like [Polistes fuscatus]|uniref:transferrin-like n=1 Tax=Polistes fuscatus TaxID=30207 RepID=UPI001CA98129|nr:transferrin-like [Polistes fuscatus]